MVVIVSCLDSAVIKLGPTGHVVWLKFGGRVRIIFASWVNFNRGQGGGEVDEEEKEGEEEGGLCLRSCRWIANLHSSAWKPS